MAENLFTKYKDFRPADYLKEKTDYSDKVYMDTQAKLKELKGAPFKELQLDQREKDTNQLISGFETLGMSPVKATGLARDLIGRPDLTDGIQSTGLLDFTPYAPLVYYLPEEIENFKRAREQGSIGGQVLSGAMIGLDLASVIPFGFLASKGAKPLKTFAESLKKKVRPNQETPQIGAFSTILDDQTVPTMLPNTKRASPNLVMTDPKKVDNFGFYSEAERQAKMMQQNKGSGAQFAGLLLNKGVKQDELDAVGLTDLFENNPNVTKKEIIDTIELNKVDLIETKKTKQLDGDIDPDDYFAPDSFTDIRKGNEGFKSADEIKEAFETGNYSRPTIKYDAMMYEGGLIDDNPVPIKLYGTINTHVPTQYKTVMFENLDDTGQDVTDIYFTFRPDADVKDWRNSIEAEEYVAEMNDKIRSEGYKVTSVDGKPKLAETKDLTLDDLAEIIEMRTPRSFDEAIVRVKGATIQDGVYDPGSIARWEGNTQQGGTNYKEYLLRLPPKGENRFGAIQLDNPKLYDRKKDFQYRTHFDEFNPIFHIRTKDRVSEDGRKILYVEELQSDWGQRGAGRGFKLEGKKLINAKKNLNSIKEEMLDLKKGGVELDGYEQEAFYKLAFPDRPPIRIPFKEPKDFRAKHDNPSKYYDTEANVKDYDFDYSLSRMPEEFRTMTFGQYMNFYKTMAEVRKGELPTRSLKYRASSILDPNDPINKYFDNKDAEFLFGQIDQPSFNADGNKFMKDLYKKYTKALGEVEGRVPSAPFVTDRNKWTALAIKRLIKIADEGNYDAIGFSPGKVQLDRWGKQSLVDYYDKIIPQVASKLPKSLGVSTDKVTLKIPLEEPSGIYNPNNSKVAISMNAEGRYFVNNIQSDKPIDGKFFNNKQDAIDFANRIENNRMTQETFVINITPKMKEKIKSGIPLFGFGGAIGAGSTMGALGNMPSTQDNAT